MIPKNVFLFLTQFYLVIIIHLLFFFFFLIGMATMKENKEKATSGGEDVQIQDDTTPSVVQKSAI